MLTLKALLHPLDGLHGLVGLDILDGLDVQHDLHYLMGKSTEALEGQGQVSGHSTVNRPQTNIDKYFLDNCFVKGDYFGNDLTRIQGVTSPEKCQKFCQV